MRWKSLGFPQIPLLTIPNDSFTLTPLNQVGGLPVHELNQLELQFLLLNDFSLVIPLEEMQRYADQLLVYGSAGSGSSSSTSSKSAQSQTKDRDRHGDVKMAGS